MGKDQMFTSPIETTPSGSRFGRLVREIQMSENVAPDVALSRAVLTKEGKELWEQARRQELEESATLGLFTQDKR